MSNKNVPETAPTIEASAKTMETATGTKDPALQNKILNQALAIIDRSGDIQAQANATLTLLASIAPKDAAESMLAAQMVATHDAATALLQRALLPDQTFEGKELNLKHAAKLLQIYARQLETLGKYRGKGSQKITVEHVTVEAGGQAIVGNVSAGTSTASETRRPTQAILDQSGNELPVPAPALPERAKARRRRQTAKDE